MAQQVNLCLPILRKQKTPFTGLALLQAWLILLLLGGGLGTAWVWNLKQASVSLSTTLATQYTELEALRAALVKNQTGAAPAQSAAEQALAQGGADLARRSAVLSALQQGYFQSGLGHAARLQLVAQTIPPEVWVTQISADEQTLEVAGFTLEPALLTTWVKRLSASPLLVGQTLNTVKVDQVKSTAAALAALPVAVPAVLPATASPMAKPAIWSFALRSSLAVPAALSGVKP